MAEDKNWRLHDHLLQRGAEAPSFDAAERGVFETLKRNGQDAGQAGKVNLPSFGAQQLEPIAQANAGQDARAALLQDFKAPIRPGGPSPGVPAKAWCSRRESLYVIAPQ